VTLYHGRLKVDANEIEQSLFEVIDTFAGQLPAEQSQNMRDLVKAGESGITLENLCTQLYEYDVTPDSVIIGKLRDLGVAMRIDPTYWELLERKR
jgi:hypothetical protein